MGGRWYARFLAVIGVGVLALGGAACGGRTLLQGADAGHGAGGSAGQGAIAGHGGGGRGGGGVQLDGGVDAASCLPPVGVLTPEPAPRQVALDGGVPIDQLPYAIAVARCDFQRRCFGVSTYVSNECVDSVASTGRWGYQSCRDVGGLWYCTGEYENFLLPTALMQAVAAGIVRYDAQREAQCIAALLAQGCSGDQLFETVPECTGILSCLPPGDAGATEGGSSCAQFVPSDGQAYRTCANDGDCAGATSPQGPDCVGGICAPTRCGITISGCTDFVPAGQPCASSALSLVTNVVTPDASCAPGLVCQGVPGDGGLGSCVVPADVGGSCVDNSSCKPGLACACGTCEIPPSTGPCVNGLCEVGVAYCEHRSNTCQPVRAEGASCANELFNNVCAPSLVCNGAVCAPPS